MPHEDFVKTQQIRIMKNNALIIDTIKGKTSLLAGSDTTLPVGV